MTVPTPKWLKMDNLDNLVPSEMRVSVGEYAAAVAADAMLAEREACAKLCDDQKVNKSPDYAPGNYFDGGCSACAKAIRART